MCLPREIKPFTIRPVHGHSQRLHLWWLPNRKLVCNQQECVNKSCYSRAGQSRWIGDVCSSVGESQRKSALWVGHSHFLHFPAPQRTLLYDSIHEKIWKMKLSPWWRSWVSGSEGNKEGTWAFWGQVNCLFSQWWSAHTDYTKSSPSGSLHRCASGNISVILQEDCRKTVKGCHLYFARSVKMVVMRTDLSQHCLWEATLLPQSRNLGKQNLREQIY